MDYSQHDTPVLRAIKDWTQDQVDEFEERAAIIEFDNNTRRSNAELLAFQQIMRARRR